MGIRVKRDTPGERATSYWYSEYQDFLEVELIPNRKEKLRLSQKKMAKITGLHQSTLSRIETMLQIPNAIEAMIIAQFYQLSEEQKREWSRLLFLHGVKDEDVKFLLRKEAFNNDVWSINRRAGGTYGIRIRVKAGRNSVPDPQFGRSLAQFFTRIPETTPADSNREEWLKFEWKRKELDEEEMLEFAQMVKVLNEIIDP